MSEEKLEKTEQAPVEKVQEEKTEVAEKQTEEKTKFVETIVNKNVAPEDFDWDALEEEAGADTYTADQTKELEGMYEVTLLKTLPFSILVGGSSVPK